MTSRAAVSVTREKDSEPVFGGIWLDAVVSTDAAVIGGRSSALAISPSPCRAAFQPAGFGSANPASTTGSSEWA